MPEIKNQFTGGKMNKDVDERLVPNGEYRHAMNIQVSTSDGSDVGTIQNILGNSEVIMPFAATGQTCVGSVSDEKNDCSYFLLAGPRFPHGKLTPTGGIFSRNHIIRLKDGAIDTVFTDIKLVIAGAEATMPLLPFDYANRTVHVTPGQAQNISVGDVLERIVHSGSGNTRLTTHTVVHVQVATGFGLPEYVVLDKLDYAFPAGDICYLFFRSSCLGFDADQPVTGINVVDDMLFWTDGFSEPKKINIPRSIQGTDADGQNRTVLINKARNITKISEIPVEEKHITVIKRGPSKPPTLKSLTSLRQDGVQGKSIDVNFTNGATPVILKSEGDTMDVVVGPVSGEVIPSIKKGDVILFNSVLSGYYPPENHEVRAVVRHYPVINGTNLELFIELMSVSTSTPMVTTNYNVAIEENGYKLFERKFPRFAYRYKYEDGEYSPIGPFSDVAFIPGHFRYHPTEAYNKGMVNNLRSLELKDFIPSNIPKDVVEVDLLYKDEVSPNIYKIRSITPIDVAWEAEGSSPASFGSYKVTTENIYAVLPSNQALRPWDNVPRSALAQEVIGSRVVYANYLQNYNLETLPTVLASITPRDIADDGHVGRKSIKSLRTYNIGIVYGDEYGRETPVFADRSSNQIVGKDNAAVSTLLKAEVNTEHPSWAKYYKFFVKETSSEYYNLALGRVYDAEDGNIWLAFPSVDRNKVDEDTYLVLKKGIENQQAILEEGRYKIVAIENEAPEYIKTTFTTIARPVASPNTKTYNVFGGTISGGLVVDIAKEPRVGVESFYIDHKIWTNDASLQYKLGMPDLENLWQEKGSSELWVNFIGNTISGSAVASQKYLITDVTLYEENEAIGTNRRVYEVFISTPLKYEDDWISNTPNSSIYMTKYRPVIYKKEVKNKPEFDGRFFVKIKNDSIANKYLTAEQTVDTSWRVAASTSLHYLRDSDAPDYDLASGTWGHVWEDILGCTSSIGCTNGTTQAISGVGNSTNMAGNVIDGIYTEAQWKETLRWSYSSVDDAMGRWFIDQTSYAGWQPANTPSWSQAITSSSKSDFSTFQTYLDDDGNSTGQNWGTGFSLGAQWKEGIYAYNDATLPNNLEHRFRLSYSQIRPSTRGSNPAALSNADWMVGKEDNSYESKHSAFVDLIKPGSRFRMKNQPYITYTITSFTTERLYNYRAALPTGYTGSGDLIDHGNPTWSKRAWELDRASSSNRRLCYDIIYTIDSENLADDLSVNSALDGVDAFTSADLQFIVPYDTDRVEPITPYPAIFETEPKEDTDLDIYYEASGKIPTSINGGDGEMLIPIGSTMRIGRTVLNNADVAGESLSSGITAVGWGGIWTSGVFQHNVININPQISNAQWNILGFGFNDDVVISFNNLNGGISYVQLIEAVVDSATGNASGLVVKAVNQHGLGWFNCWSFGNGVESNRIGDTYNKTHLINGATASTTVDSKYEEEHRKHGLIYSGLYNSTSGVNNLNQFIAAEKITKDLNPMHGSIQKLHTRSTADGDLIALCEDRVLKILANRDAVFNADGNPQLIATDNVLGQALPFTGEYGISKNPESFAAESYRSYFTDKVRGTVMRLSKDGLTPISDHGMKDWFRDNLKLSSKILGSYDDKNDEYNITISPRELQTYTTVDAPVLKSTTIVLIPSS